MDLIGLYPGIALHRPYDGQSQIVYFVIYFVIYFVVVVEVGEIHDEEVLAVAKYGLPASALISVRSLGIQSRNSP